MDKRFREHSKESVRAAKAAYLPHNYPQQLLLLGAMRAGVISRVDLGRAIDRDGLGVWRVQQQLLLKGLIFQSGRGARYTTEKPRD